MQRSRHLCHRDQHPTRPRLSSVQRPRRLYHPKISCSSCHSLPVRIAALVLLAAMQTAQVRELLQQWYHRFTLCLSSCALKSSRQFNSNSQSNTERRICFNPSSNHRTGLFARHFYATNCPWSSQREDNTIPPGSSESRRQLIDK